MTIKIRRLGKIELRPCSICGKETSGLNNQVKCTNCKYKKKKIRPFEKLQKHVQINHWSNKPKILRVPKTMTIKAILEKAGYDHNLFTINIFHGKKNVDGTQEVRKINKIILEPKNVY